MRCNHNSATSPPKTYYGGLIHGGRKMNAYRLVRCVLAAGRGDVWKKFALALMLACLLAPASSRAQNAYVTNHFSSTVSVIDTKTDTVVATIPVGLSPFGGAATPDGSKIYVANNFAATVSVIDTATNTVTATIPIGLNPLSISIQSPPRFAGVPGSSNCHGTSVSALATKFGDLDAAAAALSFPTVQGLQDAISAFCGG